MTGDTKYEIEGGGKKWQPDDIDGTALVDAKHSSGARSPFDLGKVDLADIESAPPWIKGTLKKEIKILEKAKKIIEDSKTPWKSVKIITNTEGSKRYFKKLLQHVGVKGTVEIQLK